MKVLCEQKSLAKALSLAGRALGGQSSTLPVLRHVLLATDGDRLKIAATDLEIGVVCRIEAKVEGEGGITVPGRLLAEMVSLLPQETVELSVDGATQTLRVRAGRADSRFKGLPCDEFPALPCFDPAAAVWLPAGTLKAMIGRVTFAAARDESRPMLTGALTLLDGGTLAMVASDGFRMSVCRAAIPQPVERAREMMIPARALNEVARAIGDQSEPVGLAVVAPPPGALRDSGQVLFRTALGDVSAQLIGARFPGWEKIIPASAQTRAEIPVGELLKACRRVAIFARDRARLTLDETGARVTGQGDLSGESRSDVEAAVSGPALEAVFNTAYLIDALSAMPGPKLIFESNGPHSPGVFRPAEADGVGEFTHLVMPMR